MWVMALSLIEVISVSMYDYAVSIFQILDNNHGQLDPN